MKHLLSSLILIFAFFLLVTVPQTVSAQPYSVYVVGQNSITVVNTETNAPQASILDTRFNSGGVTHMVTSPDGTRLFVARSLYNAVLVVDTVNNTVIKTIPVGAYPYSMAASSNGSRVYVTNNESNNISVIDTVSLAVIATIPVGVSPRDVAVTPDNSRVYVANQISESVSVINATTLANVQTISIGMTVGGLAITPDGTRVYVTNSTDSVYRVSIVSTATNAVTSTIPLTGKFPRSIVISPDGTRAYVANYVPGSVSVINIANNSVVTDISNEGTVTFDLAITPDGSRLYVGGTPTRVINTASNSVIATLPAYISGYGFAISKLPPTPNCFYLLSNSLPSLKPAGETVGAEIITNPGCQWSANSDSHWLTIVGSNSRIGSGTLTLSAEPNYFTYSRLGTITIANITFRVLQLADTCAYSLSASDIFIEPAGGTAGAVLTTQTGCAWTATSNVPWITINNLSGTGSGTISFTVAPNTGTSRVGLITIGGRSLAVSQPGGCAISVPSHTRVFSAAGGSGDFAVTAPNGCAWTAATSASWITINIGTGTGNNRVYFTVHSNPTGAFRSATIIVNGQSIIVEQGDVGRPPVAFDFDGDGKSDFSIYRPSVGEWWYLRSSDGGNRAFQFGSSSDKIVPADYTGDSISDFAFYRPSTGEWFILRSEDFSYYAFPFGIAEDIPAPADYDGDGKVDPAVYRPSTLTWYILKSTGGVTIQQYGASGDVPVPADYNGDGKTDLGIYNSSTQTWKFRYFTGNSGSESGLVVSGVTVGKPVVADYTGDGKADIAFYNPANNDWYITRSENGAAYTVKFGASGDIAAPADYDGDGRTDLAVYRPSTSDWWYVSSGLNGQYRVRQFGISTDIPVPSAYVR
jgi:YVTN family beta-propeller protein